MRHDMKHDCRRSIDRKALECGVSLEMWRAQQRLEESFGSGKHAVPVKHELRVVEGA
jgi:hypothetical protein